MSHPATALEPLAAPSAAPAVSTVPSPKIKSGEKRKLIYPYYAGFSEAFAEEMLNRLNVDAGKRVLDPWVGSGTTTLTSARRGAKAFGCDLSPVMTIIARARSATLLDVESARLAWRTARSLGGSFAPLPPALQARAIAAHVERTANRRGLRFTRPARALVVTALAESVRYLDRPNRASNPTWFKRPPSDLPVTFSEMRQVADEAFDRISAIFDAEYKYPVQRPAHITSDFRSLNIHPSSIDAVLTSPPYLTRIDYVKATLPETRFISGEDAVPALRRRMMGSPLVGRYEGDVVEGWGPLALRTLQDISGHPSKASATYYRSFYAKYLDNLWSSISGLSSCLKEQGRACIVVQDSYYKEIRIDLAAITVEMAAIAGMRFVDEIHFASGQSMANVNPRAVSRHKGIVETALVFQRG